MPAAEWIYMVRSWEEEEETKDTASFSASSFAVTLPRVRAL